MRRGGSHYCDNGFHSGLGIPTTFFCFSISFKDEILTTVWDEVARDM